MAVSKWFFMACGAALLGAAAWPARLPEPRTFEVVDRAPRDQLRVLWVGHSLMNSRDPHEKPEENLLDVFDRLAKDQGLGHVGLDHTLFGSPLSLLYRGSPHSYGRPVPEMKARREKFLEDAAQIDAVVLTEGLPISRSIDLEYTAYYLQSFACDVVRENPRARIYFYESWSHLHASDPDGDYPSPSAYDWFYRMELDRAQADYVTDQASTGEVPAPGIWAKFTRPFEPERGCQLPESIRIVPVGTAMAALGRLVQKEHLPYRGGRLALADLFGNAYTSWPAGWPARQQLDADAEKAALASLSKRHPNAELDDIHPSHLGVYFSALVHFATLYGREPKGLPHGIDGLPDETARRLEALAWAVVEKDPRTGV